MREELQTEGEGGLRKVEESRVNQLLMFLLLLKHVEEAPELLVIKEFRCRGCMSMWRSRRTQE